ncbi:hypothetical protein [Salinisphaera hydrothermalis]|uniref:hypothetical protein n=1 Tax=Salinisphaera hydrothermalis TaxID=563188 RepID=UPI00333FEC41
MTSWQDQLVMRPELVAVSDWPLPPASIDLDRRRRQQFDTRRNIVVAVVEKGHFPRIVARDFRISTSQVYYLLNRCLASDGDALPALAHGFIPSKNIRPYTRAKSTRSVGGPGLAGAFKQLLSQTPGLTSYLDKLLKSNLGARGARPSFSQHQIHKAFLQFLVDEGAIADDYPFNTQGQARESLRRYVRERTQAILAERASSKRRTEFTRLLSAGLFAPMERFEFDEHLADVQLQLTLRHLGGWNTTLRVRRFWLLLVLDAASKTCVGYTFGYSQNITQENVLEALASVNAPWQPKALTSPGLAYPPGAGLPAGLIPGCAHAVPLMVSLDNAWAHHSKSVRSMITQKWRAASEYGLPAVPTARAIVENVFARLESMVHALPGTTGSHVRDPLRSGSRTLPPISVEHFEELIDVVISTYNASPRSDLGGQTPIESLEQACTDQICLRHLSPLDRDRSSFFESGEDLYVHGDLKSGVRPYVNWCYARYKGPGLDQNAGLIGQRVHVTFDRRDIRELRLWSGDGRPLGSINVSGFWRGFAHSAALRRQAMRIVRKRQSDTHNPLVAYLDHLLDHRKVASSALDLLQLYRAADPTMAASLQNSGDDTGSISHPTSMREFDTTPRPQAPSAPKTSARPRPVRANHDPDWWE